MNGFTLIEILIVMILVSVIIGFSIYWYSKLTQTSFLVEETAVYLLNILNLARQKAILSEENEKWGVWLINNQKNPDLARLFRGTTSTIKETFTLPQEVGFFNPPVGSSKIIIFDKITGETTSTIISLGFSSGLTMLRYIIIPTSAAIYITSTQP